MGTTFNHVACTLPAFSISYVDKFLRQTGSGQFKAVLSRINVVLFLIFVNVITHRVYDCVEQLNEINELSMCRHPAFIMQINSLNPIIDVVTFIISQT